MILFPVFMTCFVAAAITDAVYAASEFLIWLHFSQWLIAAGIGLAILAGIAFIVHRPRRTAHGWLLLATLAVEIVNAFVHTADGWTAVVPMGIVLSVVGAILAIASAGAMWRTEIAWVEARA